MNASIYTKANDDHPRNNNSSHALPATANDITVTGASTTATTNDEQRDDSLRAAIQYAILQIIGMTNVNTIDQQQQQQRLQPSGTSATAGVHSTHTATTTTAHNAVQSLAELTFMYATQIMAHDLHHFSHHVATAASNAKHHSNVHRKRKQPSSITMTTTTATNHTDNNNNNSTARITEHDVLLLLRRSPVHIQTQVRNQLQEYATATQASLSSSNPPVVGVVGVPAVTKYDAATTTTKAVIQKKPVSSTTTRKNSNTTVVRRRRTKNRVHVLEDHRDSDTDELSSSSSSSSVSLVQTVKSRIDTTGVVHCGSSSVAATIASTLTKQPTPVLSNMPATTTKKALLLPYSLSASSTSSDEEMDRIKSKLQCKPPLPLPLLRSLDDDKKNPPPHRPTTKRFRIPSPPDRIQLEHLDDDHEYTSPREATTMMGLVVDTTTTLAATGGTSRQLIPDASIPTTTTTTQQYIANLSQDSLLSDTTGH
jgi:hypothetical protein